jgi:hypothetical protein
LPQLYAKVEAGTVVDEQQKNQNLKGRATGQYIQLRGLKRKKGIGYEVAIPKVHG